MHRRTRPWRTRVIPVIRPRRTPTGMHGRVVALESGQWHPAAWSSCWVPCSTATSGARVLNHFRVLRHYRMTVPLPDDAKVVNARFGFPQKVELLIESAEWSEVADGAVIPHFDPMFQRIQGDS